jgi:hypothetical protein
MLAVKTITAIAQRPLPPQADGAGENRVRAVACRRSPCEDRQEVGRHEHHGRRDGEGGGVRVALEFEAPAHGSCGAAPRGRAAFEVKALLRQMSEIAIAQ